MSLWGFRRAPQCQAMSFVALLVECAEQPYGLINHKNQISDISFYFEGGDGDEGLDI